MVSPFLRFFCAHVLNVAARSQKLQLTYWNNLIKDYFTPRAVLKFTLWKDNQRNEAKPFGESLFWNLLLLQILIFKHPMRCNACYQRLACQFSRGSFLSLANLA